MKLAIIGLLVVGQVLAAPERHRRDTVPGGWAAPTAEFGGQFEGGFAGGAISAGFGGEARFEGSFAGGYDGEDGGGQVYEYVPDQRDFSSFDEYGPPKIHEEYGPPPVPHEEYGPPPTLRAEPVTEHYCPEEDIVPPFAPAPAPPAELPLPGLPEYKAEVPHEEYGPPQIPHEDYGVPHEEYGPPATVPPPPAIYYAPYPAVTTTTELPIPPPPPAIYYAPYPAPTTTTEVPTTTEALPPPPPIYYAPYPAPTTTTTEVPTTVFVRIAPYPAPTTPAPILKETKKYPGKVHSKYETDSGHVSAGGSGSGGFGDEVVVPAIPEIPELSVIPAVRAPRHKKLHFIKPRLVFTKKVVSFPKFFYKKNFVKFGK